MTQLLKIDDSTKKQISALIAYAEKNPLNPFDSKEIESVNHKDFAISIPNVCYCVYIIKTVYGQRLKNLSLCTNLENNLISPGIAEELVKLFGFKNDLSYCKLEIKKVHKEIYSIVVWE